MKLLRNAFLLVMTCGLVVYPLVGVAGLVGFVLFSRPVRAWPWTVPALAGGGAALISVLPSAWKLHALGGSAAVILLGLALVLVFTRLQAVGVTWAFSGLAVGLIASGMWAAVQSSNGGQAVAFTYHPNVAAGLFIVGGFSMLGAATMPGLGSNWTLRLLRLLWLGAFVLSLTGLAFTGSRSGVIGFAAGEVVLVPFLGAWLWRRFGAWAAAAPLVLLAALAAAVFLIPLGQTTGPNLVINSGFEEGLYPWKLAAGTMRQTAAEASNASGAATRPGFEAVDGTWVTRLAHDRAGWQILLTNTEPISADENAAYTVSLHIRSDPDAISGTFLRIEARDERGTFIARAGRDGWTTGDEGSAGGRWVLPTEHEGTTGATDLDITADGSGSWTRFVATLAPTPVGTTELVLLVANDSQSVGPFGLIDALQVEKGTNASDYVPGPSAGLRAYLGPLVPRLLALRDPLSASGGRISMWYFSLELAAARPFLGYGFGVVENLVRPEAPRYVADPLPHPHSFYLQLLLEGGSLTLVAVLMWFGLVFWWLLRIALSGSWLAATTLAALVALLVQSVFDPILAEGEVLGLWWVSVAAVAATVKPYLVSTRVQAHTKN